MCKKGCKKLGGYSFPKGHKINVGRKQSEKTIQKRVEKLRGRKRTEEQRKKLSESMKGIPKSEEHKKKIGLRHSGNKCNFWKGGKSFEEYGIDWTKTLRRSIRERDKYICQLCGELQSDYAFDIHHIDYNKKNCNPDNLITLCRKCNVKVNFNREYWKQYFQSEDVQITYRDKAK